ncbi:protein lifeguard 3-like [Diaphorina citri]|jgi:Integral membrane protein, interacts with FtsH|uniref:Protein lifeguard 3-like n=1 Tax=Diaphorina citri TaxID=121845 RepID=A0A1S3DP03_DIACI|nr:protein lifeguard 3-like [Diaphorina citri]XP_008486449.1 protein lifeguard 3-like [Diaphorina citri]KAI5709545.1 hypothetical protein M8J75_001134 [Diaphorina citri]KAI5745583.1 hypothetical protein M8J76_012438 [Diaphorina citri]KAI5751141.1 hypothetical protein M8J77_004687 [Diaphorina citri]
MEESLRERTEETQQTLDIEQNPLEEAPLDDPKVRKKFIRKVYIILAIQLIFMVAIIYPFVFCEEFKNFVTTERWLHTFLVICSTFNIVTILCTIPYFPTKFPYNFIFLESLVVSIGILVGVFSMLFKVKTIYLGFIETLVLVIVLTAIAFFSPVDITQYKNIIVMCAILALVGVLCSIVLLYLFPRDFTIFRIVISLIFIVIICAYFLYDTQLIMGGKRRSIGPNDYVIAVVHLLMDIAFMFLYIIRCQDEPMFGLIK